MSGEEMSRERRSAVLAMQNMGWTVKAPQMGKPKKWEFKRADTSGLWDVATNAQSDLSMRWVAEVAMRNGDADDLVKKIRALQDEWIAERFKGILSRPE